MEIKYAVLVCFFLSVFLIPALKISVVYNVGRIAGKDRYETAIEISKFGWESSETIIITSGDDYADSLCAAPLAKKMNAPVLLSESSRLRTDLKSEILRLKASRAYIIGGENTINYDVEKQVSGMGITVSRIFGYDRYETSVRIAGLFAESFGKPRQAVIVTGENFPDAISIAPVSAALGIPILLVKHDMIPDGVAKYIAENEIEKSYIVGGENAVNSTLMSYLPNPERISGQDRYATNIAVLERFSDRINFNEVYISTGENFPDALTGAALASRNDSPIVLSGASVPQVTKNFIRSTISESSRITIFGGGDVLSDSAVSNLLFRQVVIIKADDMNIKSYNIAYSNWKRFIDYVASNKINSSIGVIGNSLFEDNTSYDVFLKNLAENGIELWNHGYDHIITEKDGNGNVYSEFENTSLEYQKDHLSKTQNLFSEKLGIISHSFGAPGNYIDSSTAKAISDIDEIKVWLFGIKTAGKLVLYRTCDIEYDTGKPDFQYMLKCYKENSEYLVIQVHPSDWSDDGFEEFKKAIDYLRTKNVVFFTPYEYYQRLMTSIG